MGFLGKAFVNWLLGEEEKVIVIVRDKYAAMDTWGSRVEIIERDLADVGSITKRHIGNPDAEGIFVHFAWEGTSGDKRALEMTQLNNIRMSCELIRRAKELGCRRFINAGSIMEYEAMKTVSADGERPSRNTMYSIAKLTADFMMKTIAADVGIDYVNIIISNIYGPGEVSRRFLNNVVRALVKNESLKLTEGYQLYDFIYTDDAMRMIKAVAERGEPFESYYIGNEKQRPLREFVLEAKTITGSSSELLFGAIPFTGQALDYQEFDCKKIRKLGVLPNVSFEKGVLETVKWVKAQ
jgi:nucleoside-diphosphate-sugar epimerase